MRSLSSSVRFVAAAIAAAVMTAAAAPAFAQARQGRQAAPAAPAAAKTATQYYLEFRAAFDKAKKIEDLAPYMSADVKKQMDATPADQRAQMFEMMKMMGTYTNLKVVSETPSATGATLNVTAVDSDKKNIKGTVQIVKENGAWKVGKESWTN